VKNAAAKDKAGVNYVTGRDIDITFLNGGIDTVKVRNQASGVYVEAVDSTKVKAAPTNRQGPPRRRIP
jgi:hypothetical protein